MARTQGSEEAVAAGGTAIYAAALDVATRLYFTRVHARVEGDTRLPDHLKLSSWREVSRQEHAADEHHSFSFTSMIFERER